MQALGMTDGFFTVLLMGGCKVVRFLLDSKNCLLLSLRAGIGIRGLSQKHGYLWVQLPPKTNGEVRDKSERRLTAGQTALISWVGEIAETQRTQNPPLLQSISVGI